MYYYQGLITHWDFQKKQLSGKVICSFSPKKHFKIVVLKLY